MSKKKENEVEIECTNEEPLGDLTFREMLDGLQNQQKFAKQIERRPTHFTIRDTSNNPFFGLFIADTHIGALGVNYESMKRVSDIIFSNPFIKVFINGDLYDNFLRFFSLRGANDALIGPSVQIEIAAKFVEELEAANQLAVIGLGNHDIDREEKAVGYSVFRKRLVPTMKDKCLEGMGSIELLLGKRKDRAEKYRLVMSHKGKGHSQYNPVHSAMKLALMEGYPDAVVVAHTHNPAMMEYYAGGKKIIAAKCGTFKEKDSYSERYFDIRGGRIGTPSILFYPDRHETFGTMNLSAAIRLYKAEMGI